MKKICCSTSWPMARFRPGGFLLIAGTVALALFFVLPGCSRNDVVTSETIRVMTFNLEDVRTDDLLREDHPRLRAMARIVQRVQPDILLLNEIAYDQPGVPGFTGDRPPGSNGQRFADLFLAVSQGPGLEPIQFESFMAPSNTGIASGFDLDHDGTAVIEFPAPPAAREDGSPAAQTAEGRAYGNDNWGFGTFPGQYAMALLVRKNHDILSLDARTFQHFLWKDLPGATRPVDPATGEPWYDDEIWDQFPLSSKSHWDVPVRLASGAVLHILASHPTPASFDGPENRNKLRNRDEIRFWNAYISDSPAIVDDRAGVGGLEAGSSFLIMGDLNADPDEGSSIDDPVGTFLLEHPLVNHRYTPVADSVGTALYPALDRDDTATWGLRADYILASIDVWIRGGAVVRTSRDPIENASDHFPVFLDISVPSD